MQELTRSQWHYAQNLFNEEIPFVVINMHYQRQIEGRIWVDSLKSPTTVIAAFAKDAYAIGDLMNPAAQQILGTINASMPETPGLRSALQAAWGSFAVTNAVMHTYSGTTFVPIVPEGYRVEIMNSNNIGAVQEFWKDQYPDTIGDFIDTCDFLHKGFGACVIHEASQSCVSACAAISVSHARCDFGLDTHPEHEGKGLATACSYAAVQRALRLNKRPVWITEHDNLASQRVAQKIGFIKSKEFEIYKRLVAE